MYGTNKGQYVWIETIHSYILVFGWLKKKEEEEETLSEFSACQCT